MKHQHLSWCFFFMKNKFLFFYILFSIISYSQSIKNDSLKIELILKKAKQEQDNLKYSETYQSLIEALQLAEKTNQNALEFKTQIAIANLHVMKGEYQLAKKNLKTTFQIILLQNIFNRITFTEKLFT